MSRYLVDGIENIIDEEIISFHMPGHKNNKEILNKYLKNMDVLDIDLTEIPGTDNLHDANDIINRSQIKLSDVYDSYKSYFLVNGSTGGILSAIYASTDKTDKILVNRNAHKSIINAIFLNELEPIYIYPEIDKESGVILGISTYDLESKLLNDKDIKVVVLTYPTYDGICFDIEKVVSIVKKYNRILIVDEAHGSHFVMNDKFPESAIKVKADIVIQSAHKNSLGLTQGAYLHINNELLVEKVEKYLEIFQTSSPSYIIMCSLDANIDFILKEGKEKSEILFKYIDGFIYHMKKNNYNIVNWGINVGTVRDIDKSKLIISALNIGINGNLLSEILRDEYKIQMEYSNFNYILAITTVFNSENDFNKLYEALNDIEKKYGTTKIERKKSLILEEVEVVLKPSDMKRFDYENIPIEDALDRVSYETITPYPPGIPLINPGELISKEAIEKIKMIKENIKVIGGENERKN